MSAHDYELLDSWIQYAYHGLTPVEGLLSCDMEQAILEWDRWGHMLPVEPGILRTLDSYTDYTLSELYLVDSLDNNPRGFDDDNYEARRSITKTTWEHNEEEADYHDLNFMNMIGYFISLIPAVKFQPFMVLYSRLCNAEIMSEEQLRAISDMNDLLSDELNNSLLELVDLLEAVQVAIKAGLLRGVGD